MMLSSSKGIKNLTIDGSKKCFRVKKIPVASTFKRKLTINKNSRQAL